MCLPHEISSWFDLTCSSNLACLPKIPLFLPTNWRDWNHQLLSKKRYAIRESTTTIQQTQKRYECLDRAGWWCLTDKTINGTFVLFEAFFFEFSPVHWPALYRLVIVQYTLRSQVKLNCPQQIDRTNWCWSNTIESKKKINDIACPVSNWPKWHTDRDFYANGHILSFKWRQSSLITAQSIRLLRLLYYCYREHTGLASWKREEVFINTKSN